MERDYGVEIEALKNELENIKGLLTRFVAHDREENDCQNVNQKRIHQMKHMHPDPRLNEIMGYLGKITEKKNRSGSITYLGVFSSGGRQSNWIQHGVNTDDLLALVENRSASTVLQCIGSNDRLSLLLALLRTPMNVAAMVERCGFNTTGQVYHHLRPLIAADLVSEVEQAERGVYAVKYHRVQGIIMLLAGVSDLVDGKYSHGEWDEKEIEP